MNPIIELFNQHRNEPFTYLMNIPVIKMLSGLNFFRSFIAEADGQLVGYIYALRYMYNCGYIGGLFVHKSFRKMSVGNKLLDTALNALGSGYKYLFTERKNTVARRMFEKAGFRKIYERLSYTVSTPLTEPQSSCSNITYDVDWDILNEAIGFRERSGVVNFGYYPIKLTREVFEDLKAQRKILRCGNILAIVENLYALNIGEYRFTYSDYIVKGLLNVQTLKNMVEVNPFYIKPNLPDLVKLVNHFTSLGEVQIRTYEGDPVVKKLPLKGVLGALTMEYENQT